MLKILIAEDDKDSALLYKRALEKRSHQVMITHNGEECLDIYHEESQNARNDINANQGIQKPFDAIILDYKMPKINGMEVAKEILAVNPHERIIFASAYVKETLVDSIKQLNKVTELMQKPFDQQALIDTIEDKEIYSELEKLNINTDYLQAGKIPHEKLIELLEILRRLQKKRTY